MTTRLRQALQSRNEQLLKQVESLVGKATPQLWHTWSTFQTGTKHTPEHTQTVEEIASLLLLDEVVAALKDDEIAMLILACHYHDLGMAGTEADNATSEGRERVRKEHAISIGERIRERWQELGFENQNYAEILAEVCRGHRPDKVGGVANWNSLPQHRNVGPNRFVRLRLISAMIYAADELHLGDDRAPKREEEWKEIASTDSLRHWHRHQAISGPTRPINAICFDARVNTALFEADIRKGFKKAFQAVADLRRELLSVEISEGLPRLEVQWLRETFWKLLITRICSDGAFRSRVEIRDQILQEFKSGEQKFESLSDLCSVNPSDDAQLNLQIDRAVTDFVTREFLMPGSDPVVFQLASDFRTAKYLLELTGEADKTDRLFGRAIDAAHEQRFYESEIGKRHIRGNIFPKIRNSYAVDVATMPGKAPLRTVLESSPTACRLLGQISPPPGNLVKNDLLQVAVTAGICFDLMNNPEGILDKDLRTAIRELFSSTAERLPRFMNFIRELAIIKDLSFDQVNAILIPSTNEKDELSQSGVESHGIHVSQSFPPERHDWSLPYLMLAGHRAQEPITILNIADAPLRVSVESDDADVSRLNDEQPATIGITPAVGPISSVVSLRANALFEPARNLLIFTCHKLAGNPQADLPVIITLPASPPKESLKLNFSFIRPALQVGQLLDLQRASEIAADGQLEVQLRVDGVGNLGSTQPGSGIPFRMTDVLPIETLTVLAEIDRALPIPTFTAPGLIEQLETAPHERRATEFEAVKVKLAQNRPSATSILLRFASSDGQDFREEYLGCLPIGCHFSAPEVSNGSMTQDQIDGLWSSGKDHFKMTMLFREDCYTLAEQVREWVDDPSEPFPFRCDNELQFHYCKTRFEQEHYPHIDRFWFIERPVVFRFCPVIRAEQYRVEMEYWRSINDERRAEMLTEMIAEEESKAPLPGGITKPERPRSESSNEANEDEKRTSNCEMNANSDRAES